MIISRCHRGASSDKQVNFSGHERSGTARKIAVVCHWGTIAALSDADAPNAGVVGLVFAPAADRPADPRWSCHRRAAADLGWHWDVVGPFAADAPAIPCVEN